MKVSATEFKATCLSLLDKVEAGGDPITITKRGRVVAQLSAANPEARPWMGLRGSVATWEGDPTAPAIEPDEVEAYR